MGVNKAILLGNLGKDPEMRYTASQMPVCSFSLATGERRKDQNGNRADHTEWHNIITFGKTAENCSQYLKKGSQVFIDGRIQTRKWQDKEGKDRYTTEIIANTVQFVGNTKGRDAAASAQAFSSPEEISAGKDLVSSLPSAEALAATAGTPSTESVPFDDDDIPF